MTTDNRPLSPHLTIYRPQISSVLSITHRATGIWLFLGALLLVIWLYSAAYDAASFASLHEHLTSWLGKLFLLGWLAAFYYHLGNGIRHLFWDIGKGYSLPAMNTTGWMVIVFTLLLTLITWGFVQEMAGG